MSSSRDDATRGHWLLADGGRSTLAARLSDAHATMRPGDLASGNSWPRATFTLKTTAFHISLVKSSQSEVLGRVLNSFYGFLKADAKLCSQTRNVAMNQLASIKMGAVLNRDPEKAIGLMQAHIDRATIYWQAILGESKSPYISSTRSYL